jgi:hypothetical protein
MPVTTAEGTGVATVVVPVSALAPEVDPEATRTADHSPLPGHSLEILGLFCYAEHGSAFWNGNWAFTGA